MGFVVYLWYYWMENVVYWSFEYLLLVLLGIGLYDFFVIYIFILVWGYFNYVNIIVDGCIMGGIIGFLVGLVVVNFWLDVSVFIGVVLFIKIVVFVVLVLFGIYVFGLFMCCIFNSFEFYIWYYVYDLLQEWCYGVNFVFILVIWDYFFGMVYLLYEGCDIKLGFLGVEEYLDSFIV